MATTTTTAPAAVGIPAAQRIPRRHGMRLRLLVPAIYIIFLLLPI